MRPSQTLAGDLHLQFHFAALIRAESVVPTFFTPSTSPFPEPPDEMLFNINRFHAFVLVTWQFSIFFASQQIFPIFSN
uniref:Uncharacterized protein n=1 Tax=Steinernema glaseri TaxID=37863 RepID=A0A1I8ATF9_9BILA